MKKIFVVFGILILGLLLTYCVNSSNSVPPSTAKAITELTFESPLSVGTINETSHTIEIVVPFGTDVTVLIPTIVHTGAGVSPPSGEAQNFTNPMVYTVTAADTSTQDYTVTVIVAPSDAKAITSFTFEDPPVVGTIYEASHTIEVVAPSGTDVTVLIPTIAHTGASINPLSGEAQDFTDPLVYTVTAADTSTQDYTATVTVAEFVCGDPLYYEGEIYSTVEIGTQCWLAKNLNVGTMVFLADGQGTSCSEIEKYCYDDNESNCETYGGLYTWTQAMCEGAQNEGAQGICPVGWHIPSDPEFVTLTNYLSGSNCSNYRSGNSNYCGAPAGDMMKAEGLCQGRNYCGDSGFNGLLGGNSSSTAYGSPTRTFSGMGSNITFWTSSIYPSNSIYDESWRSGLAIDQSGVDGTYFFSAWDNGKPIRCVKD